MMTTTPTTPTRPVILIVDDYEDAVDVWQLYLRAVGFDVLTAADGPTALALATGERRPDLIVLDIELPGMSGVDVAIELRAGSSTREIPMIAVTGYSHVTQMDLARKSGFDAVVTKPCEPAVLLSIMRRLLSQKPSVPGATM